MDKIKTLSSSTFRYKPLDSFMREYFQKTHVDYNYFLSGNSVSADLYKVNTELTTVSEGAHATVNPVGKNSSYIFDKIEKIPIFNCTQVDISLGWSEDTGYSGEMRLECIVPPSILAIEVDDYLRLLYSDFENLWKVIDASPSGFEEIYYTKLTLVPTMYKSEDIEFQVKKRYSYVYESGAVIDKLRNQNLNEIIESMNIYYKTFMSYFYLSHQLIMDKETLDSMPSKYFKLIDMSSLSILVNYFFKKYIATSLISYSIDSKYPIDKVLRFESEEDVFEYIEKDEYKIMYKFIKMIEEHNKPGASLRGAVEWLDMSKKERLADDPVKAFKQFEDPRNDVIDRKYYDLAIETLDILEIEDANTSNSDVKFLSNLKKLIKNVKMSDLDKSLIKSLYLFFIFRSISFKNITFDSKTIEYGE